jgi:outer membrane lipoprotein SlyB
MFIRDDLRQAAWMGLAVLIGASAGCAQMSPTHMGALAGTGFGAATGAVIGSGSGNAGEGALIGAAAGALGGALLGNAEQSRMERDAALAHAQNVEFQNQVMQNALTNTDVVMMAQSGLGDDVIINSIRTRGGRFDTTPQALVMLKNSGVSDFVVREMQSPGYLTAGATTVVTPPLVGPPPIGPPPPDVVFVPAPPPPPAIIIEHGHHHCGPPPFWRPRRYRGGPHVHFEVHN